MASMFNIPEYRYPKGDYVVRSYEPDTMTANVQEAKFGELYFDSKNMTYRSPEQDEEIKNLEKRLRETEENKKRDLQNIIGYFYTSRS